jgi:HK97 family phage prohead protease
MLKKLSLDATFKSMGPESDEPTAPLIIEGYASTRDLDRSCDVILPSAWTTSGGLKNFSSNPILLFNHDYDKPIGKVLDMAVDDRGLRVRGSISPSVEKIYNLVKEGILTTFSVGFCVRDAEYDDMADGLVIKDAELLEISVVSIPCNQDATFSVAKSFDS